MSRKTQVCVHQKDCPACDHLRAELEELRAKVANLLAFQLLYGKRSGALVDMLKDVINEN